MKDRMNLVNYMEKQKQASKVWEGLALIGAIGIIDFITGYEISFSLFYVIPISFVTWFINRQYGIMASIAGAVVWLSADLASGHDYANLFIPTWNTMIRLSFFLIIAWLISALKFVMEHEKKLARTDYLTGAMNSRLFFELIQVEIDRLRRYKRIFTLVYIDLDNFKTVNDQLGHAAGDQVLRTVVKHVNIHLRETDVIARLGGDEFALLLPETSQEAARVALGKLHDGLLKEMQQNSWPITFSIGALTCLEEPPSADELVRMTDNLMYMVKHHEKNGLKFATYPE